MPHFKLTQTDKERCAVLLCPPTGTVVFLAGGPDVLDTGYLTLSRTDAPVTGHLPAAIRADVLSLHGAPDDGVETSGWLAETEAALSEIRKPVETPMSRLADVRGAYLSDVEDVARLYSAPYKWIEAKTGRACPRDVRLVQAGSEAKRLQSLVDASAAEDARNAARAKVQIENAAAQCTDPVDGETFWLGLKPQPDGTRLGPKPQLVTDDETGWVAYRALGEVGLNKREGRDVLRPGDVYPDGFTVDFVKHAPRLEMTQALWNENKRALRASRKGKQMPPKGEMTLKYASLFEETYVRSFARHLSHLQSAGGFLHYFVIGCARGLRVPPLAAADIIDRAILAELGGARVYGDSSWSRESIEQMIVAAYESTDLSEVPWGSLQPKGYVDRLGERVSGLIPRLAAWVLGKDRVPAAAISEAIDDLNPDDPQEIRAVAKAMAELGLEKKRVRQADGSRVQTFIREGSDVPAPTPEPGLFVWKKTIAECAEPDILPE